MDQCSFIEEKVKLREVKGVIFDFDGTIVDLSVDWLGLKNDLRETFSISDAMGINHMLGMITHDSKNQRDIRRAFSFVEQYELQQKEQSLVHGDIVRCIKSLYSVNIRLAVFSNNMRKTVQYFLKREHIYHLFHPIVTKQDVLFFKPHPEGLEKIISAWGIDKRSLLYIGNDANDKICGERFGIPTLIITKT